MRLSLRKATEACRRALVRARWLLDNVVFGVLLGPVGRALLAGRADPVLARLPVRHRWTAKVPRPPRGPWGPYDRDTPADLRGTPGIERDPEAEAQAHAEAPLRTFDPDATLWGLSRVWRKLAVLLPEMARDSRASAASARVRPVASAAAPDPERLTRELKAEAARLGLSTVGVAAYDPRYHYEDYTDTVQGDRVVVGLLEEDHASVQGLPNPEGLKTTFATILEGNRLMFELAGWLHARGYRAYVAENMGVIIHYGVQAGLGQLGLNGQMLTPQAGSRCRPSMLSTDAPLLLDAPRDYGIPKVCDACRVCVARCPSGAIPQRRWMYRGVKKAKINTGRCLPVVSQAYGCAVCMRVCPVQKYGLGPVVEEFERSGRILGKGTEELESYTWPVDGRTYGPGERPRLSKEFMEPRTLDYVPPPYQKPPPEPAGG